MHLKALTLRGFKSFASATTLRFEPGITCVVGPNGSGKSNVVDALSLGHGRAGRQVAARRQDGGRHLRRHDRAVRRSAAPRCPSPSTTPTARCPSSTPRSPSRGSCSATAAASTRSTATPAGCWTSRSCSPTPASAARCTSSSGRASSTPSCTPIRWGAAPSSRRPPGVLKHRKRKEKALRKLDAMQANLARVQDLTDELRRQLKPLGRQAAVARRAAGHPGRPARRPAAAARRRSRRLREALRPEVADEAALKERKDAAEARAEGGAAPRGRAGGARYGR